MLLFAYFIFFILAIISALFQQVGLTIVFITIVLVIELQNIARSIIKKLDIAIKILKEIYRKQ